MLAPQVCNRCRKQRIKCDLRLPECNNCRLADVGCMFRDEVLGEDIPCSYLHSLQATQQELQRELDALENGTAIGDHFPTSESYKQDFLASIGDDDEPAPASRQMSAYLGSGNLAGLLQHLLRRALTWHLEHGVDLPPRLVPSGDRPLLSPSDRRLRALPALLSQVPQDHRKHQPELHTMLSRSAQRAVIDHYWATVAPAYPLLPAAQEASLAQVENPLRWSNFNKSDPESWVVTVIFAVSTALISRDFAPAAMAMIAPRFAEELTQLSQRPISSIDSISTMRWVCTAACAEALCAFVNATPARLWESLGRAIHIIELLRERYKIENMDLDDAFRRLELTILKMECFTSMHLRRPSYFCETYLKTAVDDVGMAQGNHAQYLYDDKELLKCLYTVASRINLDPSLSAINLDDLIPQPLRLGSSEVLDVKSISPETASLYVALHPLFTTLDLETTPALSSWTSGIGEVSRSSSDLFHSISISACTLIDHFTRLNDEGRVVSIWLTMGQTLEAGAVWAFYLIRRRTESLKRQDDTFLMSTRAMDPLLKVSALLASFAARWSPGAAFVDAWQTVVDLLWSMLS